MSLPFDKVKDDMVCYSYRILLLYFYDSLKQAKGIAKISVVSSMLENPPPGYTEDIIKWGFGSLCELIAGSGSRCV